MSTPSRIKVRRADTRHSEGDFETNAHTTDHSGIAVSTRLDFGKVPEDVTAQGVHAVNAWVRARIAAGHATVWVYATRIED